MQYSIFKRVSYRDYQNTSINSKFDLNIIVRQYEYQQDSSWSVGHACHAARKSNINRGPPHQRSRRTTGQLEVQPPGEYQDLGFSHVQSSSRRRSRPPRASPPPPSSPLPLSASPSAARRLDELEWSLDGGPDPLRGNERPPGQP